MKQFSILQWQGNIFQHNTGFTPDSCFVLLSCVSSLISLVLHFAWGQWAARENNVHSCFTLCTSWHFSLQLKTQPVGSANTILKRNTCKLLPPPQKNPPFNKYSFYITFAQRVFSASRVFFTVDFVQTSVRVTKPQCFQCLSPVLLPTSSFCLGSLSATICPVLFPSHTHFPYFRCLPEPRGGHKRPYLSCAEMTEAARFWLKCERRSREGPAS